MRRTSQVTLPRPTWCLIVTAVLLAQVMGLHPTSASAAPAVVPSSGARVSTLVPAWFAPRATAPAIAELSITKSDLADPVNLGGMVTYVLTVTNHMATPASQVQVTDMTPAGTVFQTASVLQSGGATWFYGGLSEGEAGAFTWFTGDRVGVGGGLPAGATAVLKFIVQVVGPLSDQALIHNDDYQVAAANAVPAAGTDVTTTVNAPALAVKKTATSDTVTAGERIRYTLSLTNTGHLGTTQPVTVVETLPACTDYAGSDPAASYAGDVLTWSFPAPLHVGDEITASFDVTVTVPFACGQEVVNDDYQAYSGEFTPPAIGDAVSTAVLSWPGLAIDKWVSPQAAVEAGSPLTYTLVVTNASSALAAAQATTVVDTLPTQTAFASCAPTCVHSGQTVTWTLGVLATGASQQLTLIARSYSPLITGTLLTNQAWVSATNALAPAEASASVRVHSAPLLQVSKRVAPADVAAGSTVTYTIVVTNSGNATAQGSTVTDDLPEPFTFGGMVVGDEPTVLGRRLTWEDQVITGTIWPAGWLAPAGPLTLVFTATAGGANGTTYHNAVTVTHPAGEAATGPTAPVTVDVPDLRIHKAVSPDWGLPGQPLTYTITYSNAGAVPATGVVVTDALPDFITGGYAQPAPDAGAIAAAGIISWYVGPLAGYSGNRQITLVVSLTLPLTDGVELANSASISCDEGVSAAAGPVTTLVTSAPDMRLDKTASPAPPATVSPGEPVTYTLVVENVGSDTAPSSVTDALPPGLANIASSTTANVTFVAAAGSVYTWTVAPLPPGELALITITAQVDPGVAWGQRTVLTNTATISNVRDPVIANNTDAAPLVVVPGPAATVLLAADPVATSVDCESLVTAEVLDAWGNPVADGTSIAFVTAPDSSEASPAPALTANGYASTTVTSIRPGTVMVTATAPSMASGAASITFAAGAPDSFEFELVSSPQTAGVSFTIVFTALDQFGNVASEFDGTADLSDATGTLAPLVSQPSQGGILSQTVTITHAIASDRLTATSRVTSACGVSWVASGQSNPFAVVHDGAVSLEIAPLEATLQAGKIRLYSAYAEDAFGNGWVATGDVSFATSGGNAFLGLPPGNAAFQATVVGAAFPVTGTIPGAGGMLTATASITVTHGEAALLTIAPRDAVVTAGGTVTYTAVATDAFGNGWDATGSVTWSAGGGNAFAGNVLSATVAGVWPVSGALTPPGVSDETEVTIGPASLAALQIGAVASPQTAGTSFGVTITAYDAFGNRASAFNGTLLLNDATGTLAPANWSTWSDGIASVSAAITQAWLADRITATVAATPTIYAVSQPFDVVAGSPYSVAYSVPTSLRVCESSPVTATVIDQWANPVAAGTVVTMEADGLRLWFLETGGFIYSATANSQGTVTATLSALPGAGPQSGWTRADADGVGSGRKWVAVVQPGLPAEILLEAAPQPVQVGGQTGLLTATVRDCAGNPVADGTGVSFSIVPGLVALDPGPVSTMGGTATSVFTSGTTSGSAIVTALSGEAVQTTTLVVAPGPVFSLTLAVQPAMIVANGTDTATVTADVTDRYGNPVADGTWVDFSQAPLLGSLAPDPAATTGGIARAVFTAGTVDGIAQIGADAAGVSAVVDLALTSGPDHYLALPFLMSGFAAYQLRVEAITWSPQPATAGAPVVVSVTIRNLGGTTVAMPFWVDLYLDPSSAPQAGDLWHELCLYGKAWYVRTPIPAGGTLTLNTGMPDDPLDPNNRYSYWPVGGLPTGHHSMWAQVDSYLAPPGIVHEGDETDNILGPVALDIAPAPGLDRPRPFRSPAPPEGDRDNIITIRPGGTR